MMTVTQQQKQLKKYLFCAAVCGRKSTMRWNQSRSSIDLTGLLSTAKVQISDKTSGFLRIRQNAA